MSTDDSTATTSSQLSAPTMTAPQETTTAKLDSNTSSKTTSWLLKDVPEHHRALVVIAGVALLFIFTMGLLVISSVMPMSGKESWPGAMVQVAAMFSLAAVACAATFALHQLSDR